MTTSADARATGPVSEASISFSDRPCVEHDAVAVLAGELEALVAAVNYRDWLFSVAKPYMGQRILEIGAGIGTMTSCIADRELVIALEPYAEYAAQIRSAYADNPHVRVIDGDATDTGLMSRLAPLHLDSAMTFNVLEHIEDDVAALRGIHDALLPGGHLVALVPAAPALYGEMDRAVGHVRRYTRRELTAKVRRVGFEVIQLYHLNFIGYFLWLVRGRVLRASQVAGNSPQLLAAFDRYVVPQMRAVESRWRPPFGQSLVVVGRRLIEAEQAG